MADYKLITFAIIMLSINVVLWLAQSGIEEVSAESTILLVNGSPLDSYINTVDGVSYLRADKEAFDLEVAETEDGGTGNVFTDTFKSVKQWFSKQDSNFGILTGILEQPYGFMRDNEIPAPIATAFGVIWYVILGLLILGFFRGSNQ